MSPNLEFVIMVASVVGSLALMAAGVIYLVHRQNNRRYEEYLRRQTSSGMVLTMPSRSTGEDQ